MNQEQILEIKIQAYREGMESRLSKIISEYEERIANLRVEITVISQSIKELQEHSVSSQEDTSNVTE